MSGEWMTQWTMEELAKVQKRKKKKSNLVAGKAGTKKQTKGNNCGNDTLSSNDSVRSAVMGEKKRQKRKQVLAVDTGFLSSIDTNPVDVMEEGRVPDGNVEGFTTDDDSFVFVSSDDDEPVSTELTIRRLHPTAPVIHKLRRWDRRLGRSVKLTISPDLVVFD
jgi:hypothetical protein